MLGRNVGERNGGAARPRPPLLRALGRDDPPPDVTVDGVRYRRVDVFKHDSWAATAEYADVDGCRILCKFNRTQSIFGIPCRPLGRLLARREADFLRRLADLPNVPRLLGAVVVDGRVQPNAVARSYIAGHPLGRGEAVDDRFFPELQQLLDVVHRREMAYVDLHKRENVLVGDDGRPYLIDFQVSFALDGLRRLPLGRRLLHSLQRMDDYNRVKLQLHCRPDQCEAVRDDLPALRPALVRWHRRLTQPLRSLRRRLLVLLGVRRGKGRAESEAFAEAAFRTPSQV